MELLEVLRHRKMVRSFRPDPVPREVIDRVVASMRHAPSAGFTQGTEVLVLSDPDAVRTFYDLTDDPAFPWPEGRAVAAPVVIVPMANESAYIGRYSEPDKLPFGLDDPANWPVPFWLTDAAMAAMLMLLVAIDEGLGAWFSGISYGERSVLHQFGVPAEFKPVGVVMLGYPAASDPLSTPSSAYSRPRRPVADLMHHDRW